MLSLSNAIKLKDAGLAWQPLLHDFFAIPQPGLDHRLFVVSDMMIDIQRLYGHAVITFNGSVEWSLDYILIADVVWMPTETQLRRVLQERLLGQTQPVVQLVSLQDGYRCQFQYKGESHYFDAGEASDAYCQALLYVLGQEATKKDRAGN